MVTHVVFVVAGAYMLLASLLPLMLSRVAVSPPMVLVHGVAATPWMAWLERRPGSPPGK